MPRARRYFISKEPYTITFRARRGLPIVATLYMSLLLTGIMARAQRDKKVTLCHYLWMANHVHMIVMINDPEKAALFYGEVQKKITESIKSLLALDHLSLWEGGPVVAHIGDTAAMLDQITYLYANPARAHLIGSITEYPGCSSWQAFNSTAHEIPAMHSIPTRWIPSSIVPLLPSRGMRKQGDLDFTEALNLLGEATTLDLHPNAWMEAMGIFDPKEVAALNAQIITDLFAREQQYQKEREEKKRSVLGERALRTQAILKDYTPKKRSERRIFYISSDKEDRISYIAHFKELCAIARQCFLDTLNNLAVTWPPGMFRPPMRHVASAI